MLILKAFAIVVVIIIAVLLYCPFIRSGQISRMEERRELENEKHTG